MSNVKEIYSKLLKNKPSLYIEYDENLGVWHIRIGCGYEIFIPKSVASLVKMGKHIMSIIWAQRVIYDKIYG